MKPNPKPFFMKKLYFSIVLLLASISTFVAQQKPTAAHECGSDRVHLENLKSTSDYKMNFDKQNIDYQTWVLKQLKGKLKTLDNQAYTPPPLSPQHLLTVVFHDMLLPNATPVTIDNYGYIVEGLNAIFSGTNLGGKQDANDTGIRFCSAQQDDNGKSYTLAASRPSTSIISIDNEQSPPLAINTTISESKFSNNVTLDSNFSTKKFINIYIVDNIVGNVAGFAYMPPSHGSFRDGIFIERAFLKNDANFANNINVLAHEMGHYLGLFHIFGICSPDVLPIFPQCSCDNGNPLFNGDMVADTPPSQLNVTQTNCATTFDTCPLSAGNDDKANYMDYGNWNCQYKFSLGQIQRMRFMIDPETGPRKSLLASQNACTDCTAMSGIGFSIVAPAGMGVDPHFALNSVGQVQAGVFTVSATTTATTTTIPVLQYTWSIVALNGNNATTVAGSSATNETYIVPTNLVIGNYRLTVRVGTSITCFKDLTFDFQVLPHTPAGSCNLSLPSNDSWAGWNRSSYVNGWQYGSAPTFALISGAARYTPTDANFDHSGFAVITNPQTSLNDSRFATANNLPMTVTKVIRVGRKIENAGTPLLVGNAYYANVAITPTQANCKFRIWYLGYRESNIVLYNDTYQHAAAETNFGFVTEYRFKSTLAPTAGVNTIIGSSEYGPVTGSTGSLILNNGSYNHNDLMSMCLNNSSDSFNNYAMAGWKFFDVDYSEFIGSGLNTELTLTFFARSNTAQNALKSSYCYYAVECLGSGVPKNYSLNLPDIDLSCGKASDGICATKSIIPAPNYGIKRQNQDNIPNRISLFWAQQPNNLGKIKIYKEATTGIFNEYNTTVNGNGGLGYALSTIYKPLLCMNSVDAPRKRFIIEVETLHKIVRDTITVSAGFYALPPLPPVCSVPDKAIGGSIPEGVSSTVSICASASTMPLLVMNNPCWAPSGQGLQYQWFSSAGLITGATAKDYQITNYDAANGLSNFYREVYYENPYCKGTGTWLPSEIYIINTITQETLNFGFLPRPDFCQNSIIPINLAGLNIGAIPIGSTLSSNPTVTFAIIYQNTVVSAITVSCTVSALNQVTIPSSATISFNNMVSNGSFILPVGNSILYLRVIKNITTIQNCSFGSLDYRCDVFIKPSAGGGQILYNCLANNITSVSDGVAGTNGYQWQYSATTAGTFATFANAPTTPTLATAQLNQIAALLGTNIFFVRRVSTPFGQCPNISNSNAVRVNMSTQNQTPAFTELPTSICQGTPAPVLPTTSDNLIGGNWVALNNSTATVKNFEFVPLPSQCVTTPNVTYSYTIKSIITPIFALPVSICANVPLSLPTISENDIAGVWSPNIVSQTGVYTFTPASGTCAVAVSKTITISPATNLIFTQLLNTYDLCIDSPVINLSLNDFNGVAGVWKNQNNIIVSVITTNVSGIFNYTFYPYDVNICKLFKIVVTVKPKSITPTFLFNTSFCLGNTPPILPTTSSNGIAGTWAPTLVSNQTALYQFTPLPGQCAITPQPTLITVAEHCDLSIVWNAEVGCQVQDENNPIKNEANILDTNCIRICANSQVTYQINSNSAIITNTNWIITGGTVINSTTTSCTIQWGAAANNAINAIVSFSNGNVINFDKCIQVVKTPTADFSISPFGNNGPFEVCLNTILNFNNLSIAGDGNENLYYNWDFGDGTFSNEKNPTHQYLEGGSFKATLRVTNGCSCIAEIKKKIIVNEGDLNIVCNSVVCDGQVANYSLKSDLVNNCAFTWKAIGGTIVNQSENTADVNVLWNDVNKDGFGTLLVHSSDCTNCVTSIKIPVVQSNGAIFGKASICKNEQAKYSLPQWPTTDFVWSIAETNTNAILLTNNQRNEIILQSNQSGYVKLKCNYTNTLLGCKGSAEFFVNIKSALNIAGNTIVCANTNAQYFLQNENNQNIEGYIPWIVTGPNNFQANGQTSTIDVAFPVEGNYKIDVLPESNFCVSNSFEIKASKAPTAPLNITTVVPICPGNPVTYNCAPQSGSTTHWAVINGTIIGADTGNNVLINFDALATTPFIVQTWYENETCKSTIKTTIIPRQQPNLSLIQNDAIVCSSSIGNYGINNIDAENYTWTIVPETAGSVQTGQGTRTITVLWNENAATPFLANLKLVVRKCGIDYPAAFYPVSVVKSPTVNIIAPTGVLCANKKYQFSTDIGNFSTAVWDFGNERLVGTPSTMFVEHAYINQTDLPLSFIVKVTLYGANNCLHPTSATKVVIVQPETLVKIIPSKVCTASPAYNNGTATFTVQPLSGTFTNETFQWFKNGTPILAASNGNSATINVSQSGLGQGDYTVIVTNQNGCITAKKMQPNSVYDCGYACVNNTLIDFETQWACGVTAQPTILPTAGFVKTRWEFNNDPIAAVNGNFLILSEDNPSYRVGSNELKLMAFYNYNGLICHTEKIKNIIIPYKPSLHYTMSCADNGYQVTLIDKSSVYAQTPVTSVLFRFKDTEPWQNAQIVNGVAQLVGNNLPAGTYQLGIKISNPNYMACQYTRELILPAIPSAFFTFPDNICKNSPVTFIAADSTPGLRYHWSFAGTAFNLKKDPVRVFNGAGQFIVTLTVTNNIGCTRSYSTLVTVQKHDMRGEIKTLPNSACENNGNLIRFKYKSFPYRDQPTKFIWFNNNNVQNPIATTTFPIDYIDIGTMGQYYCYVENANGCRSYGADAKTAVFVPAPPPPTISGNTSACKNNNFTLKVTASATLKYVWSLNGVPQPQWNNQDTITDIQSQVGSYSYSVVAQSVADNNVLCNGTPSVWQVNILDEPTMPNIVVTDVSCNPYKVSAMVSNPIAGVQYLWSNGTEGTTTTVNHDGPLRVKAISNGCIADSQIDLPLDLDALSWVFPKGCYATCEEKPTAYILGPLGNLYSWAWLINHDVSASGTGSMPANHQLQPGFDFQMLISNGNCQKIVENMSYNRTQCKECSLNTKIYFEQNYVFKEKCFSKIKMSIANGNGIPMWVTLTAPNNEGYFSTTPPIDSNPTNNAIYVPDYGVEIGVYFVRYSETLISPLSVMINGFYTENIYSCQQIVTVDLPENCTDGQWFEPKIIKTPSEDFFSVFPNPTNNMITVSYQLQEVQISQIVVADLLGRSIITQQTDGSGNQQTIDCSQLAQGTYLLLLKSVDTIVKQTKLIKK